MDSMEINDTSGNAWGTPAYVGRTPLPFHLVLEGGAMRGLFTAGVLDYLLEQGVLAKRTIGVSAGALVGYNYVCGAIGRTAYINLSTAMMPAISPQAISCSPEMHSASTSRSTRFPISLIRSIWTTSTAPL